MVRLLSLALVSLVAACGLDGPAPPPVGTAPIQGPAQPVAPPGMTLVTVVATSTPPGAAVTGGGTALGQTPLTRQVPIPTPAPGAPPPSFEFNFARAGFRPVTVQGALSGTTVTVNATLVSQKAAAMEDEQGGGEEEVTADEGTGEQLTVRGTGGGRIYDNHTTTATARVGQDCVMASARIAIHGSHRYNRDLHVQVRGPNGVRARLQRRSSTSPFRTHRIAHVSGKRSAGTWTLSIRDEMNEDSGQLAGFTLSIHCR